MDINFFDEIQPCIIDRLGRIYNSDSKYKKSIEAESKILSQLKEHLTESQMQLVKKYHNAIYATAGICEMLSYWQGMRDLASILAIESNEKK